MVYKKTELLAALLSNRTATFGLELTLVVRNLYRGNLSGKKNRPGFKPNSVKANK